LILPLWHDQRSRFALCLIVGLILGAWRFAIAQPQADPLAISHFIDSGPLTLQGTIIDEPKLQGHSRMLIIAVSKVSRDGGITWQDSDGQVVVQTLGAEVEDPYGANYGDVVKLQGKLQAPLPYSSMETIASMLFPRISVRAHSANPILAFLYHARIALANIIAQALPQPEAAVLIAILLSIHTPALKPITTAFNVTGTAHLIAPSGFKVTILASLVATSASWITRKQRTHSKLLPAQKRGGWQHWLVMVLQIVSITTYTVLSGAGPAALRAGMMGILLIVAPRIGRTYNVYTALALTAFVMSLVDPFVLWDVGFLLSFLGTLGIVLLTPYFQRLLHPLEHLPFGSQIVELSAVTLAAQTATLPIFAVTFHQISFIAPLVNILTVPLLAILIGLGLLICCSGLLSLPLALLCGWLTWPILWYVTNVIIWCATLPGAYTTIDSIDGFISWGYYAALALLTGFLLLKRPNPIPAAQSHSNPTFLAGLTPRTWRIAQLGVALLILLATGGMALAARPTGLLTITFLNLIPAGQSPQGEAILIRTPEGHTILIDGGPDAASLSQELDSRLPSWQRSLDVVVLTTPERDHITGLQDIIHRYQVGEVIDAGMLHPGTTYSLWRRSISDRNLKYISVARGATIPLGSEVSLQVLWPGPLHKGSSEVRDNTLVARLLAPGLRVLLLGTAAESQYALTGLLTDTDSNYLQAPIVQVVGEVNKSWPAKLQDVLTKARPSLLVITPAGLNAKQRKMHQATMIAPANLAFALQSGWQTMQTAQIGTIEVSSSNTGWNVNVMSSS
jgi:ComEC/Rec2-related protein